jgi:hypothetical protein
MDYTGSNSYTTDVSTGNRMHSQAQAVPTAVSDSDLNGLIWELLSVIRGAGITPLAFDKTIPATYSQVYSAVQTLIANAVAASTGNGLKTPVRFTSTGNVVLSGLGTQAGGDWGVALTAGDRILPKDQTTGSQNGIYIAAAGAWARATDADGVGELPPGALVVVQEGVTLAESVWELSTDGPITIGTTALSFVRKDNVGVGASVQGAFKKLRIDSLGVNNYNCVITADEVVLENSANAYATVRAVNKTINANGTVGAPLSIMSARAASTWYFPWLWYSASNGLTATLDVSSTAPTPPTGYTASDYKALLPGARRTDSSGGTYLMQISTTDRRSKYVPLAASNVVALPQMVSGTAGAPATPTFVSIGVSNFVPPNAVAISVNSAFQGGGGFACVSPSNAYTSYLHCPVAYAGAAANNQHLVAQNSVLSLESTSIYWASSCTDVSSLRCYGWEDVS